jgi:murein DD-endopeptidase MepM/ murein hydrolase activator NlpD
VYAHNQNNRVREGQHVRGGEVIATVGDSGHTSGANLHFEVRQDNIAEDPLDFLPSSEQVAAPERPAQRGS